MTTIEIEPWMAELSSQGSRIHQTIVQKLGTDEWQLGDIASRKLVLRLERQLKEAVKVLERLKHLSSIWSPVSLSEEEVERRVVDALAKIEQLKTIP